MRKFGAVAGAFALLLTSGCGGGRPSEGDVSDAIQSGMEQLDSFTASGVKITDKVADCMAKALHGSKLSDEALKAMVDQDRDYKPSKGDQKALLQSAGDFVKCIPGLEGLGKKLNGLDPDTLPDELRDLDPEAMQKQLGDLDPDKLKKQLDGLDPEKLKKQFEDLDPEKLAKQLEELDPAELQKQLDDLSK